MGGFDECAWVVGGETEKVHEVQVRNSDKSSGSTYLYFLGPERLFGS